MEPKLIYGIAHGLGLSAYLGGILVNLGDWKSNILFGLGVLYAIARFIVYCIKSRQDIRWRDRYLRDNDNKPTK